MPLTIINPITYTDTQTSLSVPAGTIIASSLHVRPTGFLECDGSNTVSRTAYSNLFNAIVPNKGTVTITNVATLALVTLNSHGFLTGESIFLTTTGSLFTGLSPDTLYFVIVIDSNTFRLALSYANALSSTAINVSGTQSGTHTLFYCPYGLGNNTSNFKLPDLKNATIRGRGLSTGFTQSGTTRLGYLEDDGIQGHKHQITDVTTQQLGVFANPQGSIYGPYPNGGYNYYFYLSDKTGTALTDTTNGTPRTGLETRMKNQGVNFFIKF